MATIQEDEVTETEAAPAGQIDMKLEVVPVPVSDADRAADFYARLGWRVDADVRLPDGGRILQFTPPGSSASIVVGTGLSPAAPGSAQYLELVVSDIEAAERDLVARGIETSGVFHDSTGGFNPFDPRIRAGGPDPQRRSYGSYATFGDPDGNLWLLQEITARHPGRVASDTTSYASVRDLAEAMRRAEAAHGEHERRMGGARDENWPAWYAEYMVAEQAGKPLPQ
ncbi:MAG TPA: VOC family protein [Allosphingosinicella sp.]|nr:VOC family protein [Allosphingosinicella sp.]